MRLESSPMWYGMALEPPNPWSSNLAIKMCTIAESVLLRIFYSFIELNEN